MACTGKFMMSCSARTDIVLYDLNGAILSKLDTVLGKNFWAKISPDGKLLASSGFTPDVKVRLIVYHDSIAKIGGQIPCSRKFPKSITFTGMGSQIFTRIWRI